MNKQLFLIPPISPNALSPTHPGTHARNLWANFNTSLPFISQLNQLSNPSNFIFKLQLDSGQFPLFLLSPPSSKSPLPLTWSTAVLSGLVSLFPLSAFSILKMCTVFYLKCKWGHVTFLGKILQ